MSILVNRDDGYDEITDYLSELDSNRILSHLKKANAIEIPKNATNGEALQLLFPGCVVNDNFGGAIITNIDGQQFWHKSWWNDKYERGTK